MTGGRRSSGERGSGTVLVLGLSAVVLVLLSVVLLLGSVVTARHRASVSADLAALAGADVVLGRAGGDPCGRAAEVARAHDSLLERCVVGTDDSVAVAVSTRPRGGAAVLGTATAHARAGPGPEG